MLRRFLICAALASVPAFAGGFWLQVGNPDANPAARGMNAVVLVKPVGCHEPEKAKVSAVAIGIANGQRKAIPLSLRPLPDAVYAIARQWPTDGTWAVAVTGTDKTGLTTSAVMAATGTGIDRSSVKFAPHAPTEAEIAAVLEAARTLAQK